MFVGSAHCTYDVRLCIVVAVGRGGPTYLPGPTRGPGWAGPGQLQSETGRAGLGWAALVRA